MLKRKRLISTLLSVLLSTMLTTNVSALEYSDINIIQSSIGDNIQTLQFDNIPEYGIDVPHNVVAFDNAGGTNEFNGSDITDILVADITEPIQTAEEDAAMPYSTASPLSDLRITAVALCNSPYGSDEPNWSFIDLNQSAIGSAYASCTIDSTGYTHIAIRVRQWGYTTGGSSTLDGKRDTYSKRYKEYDRYGNVLGAGDILYSTEDYYIFEIPKNELYSTAKFIGYYNYVSPMITKEAKLNITWSTPTGPAPTTPEIFYNSELDGYAIVTGLTTDMEYCGEFKYIDSEKKYRSDWNSVTSEAMYVPINNEPYTFLIRYKKSTNGYPSLNCSIPVKSRPEAPSAEYIGYYDILEILALYPCDKQIEIAIGDGNRYVPVSAGYYDVENYIDAIAPSEFNRIYIRYAATIDEPASKPEVIKLYRRNPNTPDNVYYQDGMLYNLTSDMVFRFDGGDWLSTDYAELNITSILSNTETTLLEIRYMPTENYSCSATRQIILPALS